MLVNIHIPKNAGTTINAILTKNFGDRHINFHTHFKNDRKGQFFSNSEFIALIEEMKSKATVISGHDLRPLDAKTSKSLGINYFTFLRHPVQRAISLYYYEKSTTEKDHISQYTFEEYVKERPKYDNAISNWQTYNLTETNNFEQARDALENFIVVGLVEEFDKSLILLRESLKIPHFRIDYKQLNKSSNKKVSLETIPQDTLERLMELNQEDLKLYNYAVERFNQDVAKILNLESKQRRLKQENYVFNSFSNLKLSLKKTLQIS